MALKLWTKDGKVIVDSNGRPIMCETCPCGSEEPGIHITFRGETSQNGTVIGLNCGDTVKDPWKIQWKVSTVVPSSFFNTIYEQNIGEWDHNKVTQYFNMQGEYKLFNYAVYAYDSENPPCFLTKTKVYDEFSSYYSFTTRLVSAQFDVDEWRMENVPIELKPQNLYRNGDSHSYLTWTTDLRRGSTFYGDSYIIDQSNVHGNRTYIRTTPGIYSYDSFCYDRFQIVSGTTVNNFNWYDYINTSYGGDCGTCVKEVYPFPNSATAIQFEILEDIHNNVKTVQDTNILLGKRTFKWKTSGNLFNCSQIDACYKACYGIGSDTILSGWYEWEVRAVE